MFQMVFIIFLLSKFVKLKLKGYLTKFRIRRLGKEL